MYIWFWGLGLHLNTKCSHDSSTSPFFSRYIKFKGSLSCLQKRTKLTLLIWCQLHPDLFVNNTIWLIDCYDICKWKVFEISRDRLKILMAFFCLWGGWRSLSLQPFSLFDNFVIKVFTNSVCLQFSDEYSVSNQKLVSVHIVCYDAIQMSLTAVEGSCKWMDSIYIGSVLS